MSIPFMDDVQHEAGGFQQHMPMCPCPIHHDHHEAGTSQPFRTLQQQDDGENDDDDTKLWEIIYSVAVLLYMTIALLTDRIGADSVMLSAVTAFLAAGIISVEEGIEGFSNPGLLTVIVLFVVAEGISKTGALDWYMQKLLGRPSTTASAQLRLMVPIAIVSAFLNNTPVVAVMIPIVQRWGQNIRINPQQLLIPLSFASILGGTCTLIGTSTNLVVTGLLDERYKNDPDVSVTIGLFDLGQYGVPIAMAGICYILLTSPYLIPGAAGDGGGGNNGGAIQLNSQEDVLLGARLCAWSPAAGRSVKRSGLRDTGGIYLVSVHRSATGNVHRAVGQEFVLQIGDILYFTGLVEGFGEFCEEHGLELVTSESITTANTAAAAAGSPTPSTSLPASQIDATVATGEAPSSAQNDANTPRDETADTTVSQDFDKKQNLLISKTKNSSLPVVVEGDELLSSDAHGIPIEVGVTKESLLQADEAERSRSLTRMIDLIRGQARDEPAEEALTMMSSASNSLSAGGKKRRVMNRPVTEGIGGAAAPKAPPKIVVTSDQGFVTVGINNNDRPGLLLDISKGLLSLNLTLRHTEAAVVGTRSVSIWRCELLDSEIPDLEEIWSVLNALLESESGILAVKTRGLRVIRAVITKTSTLIGKTASDIDFRRRYKAGIVAVQKGGRNVPLSGVRFGPGDVLVLQAGEGSPLLKSPPGDFYKRHTDKMQHSTDGGSMTKPGSVASFVNIFRSKSNASLEKQNVPANNAGQHKSPLTKRHSRPIEEVAEEEKAEYDAIDEQDIEANRAAAAAAGADVDAMPTPTPTSQASGSNDYDDDYFLESGDDDEYSVGQSAVEVSGLESVDQTLMEEAAWKDIQVYLPAQNGDNDGGGSGGATREFLTAMEVAPHSKLASRTVAEIGLDKLPGVFLVSIDRPTGKPHAEIKKQKVTVITTPSDASAGGRDSETASVANIEATFITIAPETPLQVGDVLWFSGSASAVGDLRKIPGLMSYESDEVEKINEKVHDRRLVEAVVARRGPLVGKSVKEVRFRTKYGAAVIAVHRDGKRVHEHPGRIKLQAGDVLLLEAGPTFIKRSVDNDRSFALLAEVEDSAPPRLALLIPALVITAAMLTIFTAGVASLLICALVASIVMVMLGILSEQEARDAVNWDVYITIASAFGIGTALVNSGVAGGVASFLVNVGEAVGIGDAGLLAAVYLATFLISNVVTNNAAAALIFPIALDAAEQTGIDRVIMSYCLMLGASASFMSPFGYTTNLLIYGPGGYKYKDFLTVGTPMQLVLWILSIFFLSIDVDQWWLSWIITSLSLVVVVIVRVFNISPFALLSSSLKNKTTTQEEVAKI
mmetsp:Transcript_18082/g.51383  ORF Transcript_18082/g.51383 Transcript_18082/m.51383 type:complete len:1343 (+) Transcript_18082:187-4215(+)